MLSGFLPVFFLFSGCLTDRAPVFLEPFEEEDASCEIAFYPCGDFSELSCGNLSIINDLSFLPANDAAHQVVTDDELFDLHDLYQDESIAGVLLFGTAGWCQFCSQEGEWLIEIYEDYQDIGDGRRLEFVAVVFQDDYGDPATAEYAEAYAARRGFPFPAVADTTGGLLDYFDPQGAPGNVFVNRSDMTIQQVIQGFDESDLQAGLAALDGLSTCL